MTLACMALVPLNPSGAELYRYPLDTLRSHGMRTYIVESFSPDFHRPLYFPLLLVFILLIVSFAVPRSPLKGRVLLPLLFTAIAAFDAGAPHPYLYSARNPRNRSEARFLLDLGRARDPTFFSTTRPDFFNPITLVLLAFLLYSGGSVSRTISLPPRLRCFRREAVTFLQANPQSQRAFIFYDWGGYAIWKLHPEYLVFADGRADLYGDALLRDCIQTVIHLHLGWEKVLDNYSVQTILIPPNTALAQALLLNPKWTPRYRDPQAVVFVRRNTSPAGMTDNSPTASMGNSRGQRRSLGGVTDISSTAQLRNPKP